jgi:hypothetical protein
MAMNENAAPHSDSTAEGDDEFHKDWIQLGAEKDTDFSSDLSVASELLMNGVSIIDDLCVDCKGGRSTRGRGR